MAPQKCGVICPMIRRFIMGKKYNRIFTIVLDSMGIGAMADSEKFGDVGVDTLGHISQTVDKFAETWYCKFKRIKAGKAGGKS